MQKIFISWCGADRSFKNQVYDKMRARFDDTLDIWESDERCVSNFSEECIENIKNSDVFVLLLSESAQSPKSYVLNEVIAARGAEGEGKLNIVVYNIDSSELTDGFAMQINHISDANHIKAMRGADDNIDVLIDRVAELLKRRAEGNPEKPMRVLEPQIEGLPIVNNNYYVANSRDEVLEELDADLQESNVVFINEISGYGRKSVAKIYATLHADDYDCALEIYTPCNSLREFFVSGLRFKNISEDVYENLDEQHIILQKIKFLEQLANECNKRVLLLVPFCKIANKELNDFMYTSLKTLPVKILFVTENVSREISDRFATVNIGRMENRYLQELFFHYVDLGKDERQTVLPAINGFFDSVGGHTAAVELMSKTVADEFGLTTEDIVEALHKVSPDSDNDLSERIYSAYANLFSLKQFSEQQCKILSVLSLLVDAPVSEKFIVDLLRNAEIYDAPSLRSLCDMGWIKRDISAKILWVEPIIAKVCLSNCHIDGEVVAKCLRFNAAKLERFDLAGEAATGLLYSAKLYTYIQANALAGVCEWVYEWFSGTELHRAAFTGLDELLDKASEEADEMDDAFEEVNCSLLNVGWSCSLIFGADNDTETDSEKDVIERSEFLKKILDVQATLLEENGGVFALREQGLLGKMYGKILSMREDASVDTLIKLLDSFVACKAEFLKDGAQQDMLLAVCRLLQALIMRIVEAQPTGPSKSELSRAWVKCVDAYDTVFGKTVVYETHTARVIWLHQIGADPKEISKELDFCWSMLDKYKSELFANQELYGKSVATMLLIKANVAYLQNRFEEAIDILSDFVNGPFFGIDYATDAVNNAERILEHFVQTNKTEQAKAFIQRVFTPCLVQSLVRLDEDAKDELARVNSYLDLIETDDGKILEENNFSEEKQSDYYAEYGQETCDKRTYRLYEKICDDAQKFDFSSCSQQEILQKAAELKQSAATTQDWKEIAPEAFALVSEAGFRVLGYRHHWVQYFGACCMLDGNIAQILNGEGKTYTVLLVAFVHCLFGRKVDVLDAVEHLCYRNYNWVGGVLRYLGLRVGIVHSLNNSVLSCDIRYASLGNYLMALCNEEGKWDFGLEAKKAIGDAAIIDEADEVMISLGCREHIVVKKTSTTDNVFVPAAVARAMEEIRSDTEPYFKIDARNSITVKEKLYALVKSIHEKMPDKDVNWEIGLRSTIISALSVYFCKHKGKDYYIEDGKIRIEDLQTGELNDYGRGLFAYFIAKKENLFATEHAYNQMLTKTEAVQYYEFAELYKLYAHVCGTTATAMSMKNEFKTLYGKNVVCVPPNRPVERVDHRAVFYIGKQYKDVAILELVEKMHASGRPVLIIAASMYEAEAYSAMLRGKGIEHTILNAKNADEEERILSNCGRLNAVTVATAIANRGVDIALGGSASFITKNSLRRMGFTDEEIARALSGEQSPLSKSIAMYYASTLQTVIDDVQTNREQVQRLGGLAVICTSCFEELRVEQQARGRCGRQGQPGESWVFMSGDDPVLKMIFGNVVSLFSGVSDGMDSDFLHKAIARWRRREQSYTNIRNFTLCKMTYTDSYRDKITGLAYRLYEGKADYRDVYKQYVVENDSFIKRWMRDTMSDSDKRLLKILLGTQEIPVSPKRKEAKALMRSAFERFEPDLTPSVSRNVVFAVMLKKMWPIFFNKVWERFDIYKKEYGSKPAVCKKKTQEFAEACFEQTMRDAIAYLLSVNGKEA